MSSTDPITNRTSRPALVGLRALRDDDGAATAEYVIATMAAVGLAGLLVTILRGDAVKEILMGLVRTALSVAG
jgi:Flp pilus assembly pilin Flp